MPKLKDLSQTTGNREQDHARIQKPDNIERLSSMGFSKASVNGALLMSRGDFNYALEILLEQQNSEVSSH